MVEKSENFLRLGGVTILIRFYCKIKFISWIISIREISQMDSNVLNRFDIYQLESVDRNEKTSELLKVILKFKCNLGFFTRL